MIAGRADDLIYQTHNVDDYAESNESHFQIPYAIRRLVSGNVQGFRHRPSNFPDYFQPFPKSIPTFLQ